MDLSVFRGCTCLPDNILFQQKVRSFYKIDFRRKILLNWGVFWEESSIERHGRVLPMASV